LNFSSTGYANSIAAIEDGTTLVVAYDQSTNSVPMYSIVFDGSSYQEITQATALTGTPDPGYFYRFPQVIPITGGYAMTYCDNTENQAARLTFWYTNGTAQKGSVVVNPGTNPGFPRTGQFYDGSFAIVVGSSDGAEAIARFWDVKGNSILSTLS
jgi:hypothetical protein